MRTCQTLPAPPLGLMAAVTRARASPDGNAMRRVPKKKGGRIVL